MRRLFKILVPILVLGSSLTLYLLGLIHSPLLHPEQLAERRYVEHFLQQNAPDLEQERKLAEAYWRRYRDVAQDSYYGRQGPMGIFGAREHYQQHGRREGRIFAPLPEPETPDRETILAEAYWRRYPDIAASAVWGRTSELGTLGPRDHYTHRGRANGRVWGAPSPKPPGAENKNH